MGAMSLSDDPLLGQFVDTPEKRAKWIARVRIASLLWVIFACCGVFFFIVYYLFLN